MRRERRGIALMTALFFMVFLLVVGLTFMTLMAQDYRFAGQQERSRQAYFLAEAGMDFYKARASTFAPGGAAQEYGLPEGDAQHQFRVWVEADLTVRSTGMIKDAYGNIKAQRTLVAPQGNFGARYDAG